MAQEEQIIISDLLSYMACNIDICEKAALIETIQNYYPEEVISETLDTLVSAIPSKIYKRLSSLTVNDAADAIYSYLKLLPKKKIPIFVCRNLNNLPGAESDADSIELNDDIPMVDIRSQQEEMKNVIGEISKSVNLMKNQVQLLVHRAIKHHLHESEEADVDLSNSDTIQSLPYLQSLIYRNNRKRQAAVDTDDYGIDTVENNIRLEDAEEDIHDDLFPPDELTNMPNHRTLKFETADGHLLMTTSNDAMNFDENLCSDNENNIEVRDDNRPIIEAKRNRDSEENPVGKYFYVKIENSSASNGNKELSFLCSSCNFASTDYSVTARHLCVQNAEHCSKQKQFVCKQCSFSSSRIREVNDHLFYHETCKRSSKFFECFWCSNKCRSDEELNSHLSHHTTIAPFACHCCDFKCLEIQKLRNHWRRHWEEKGPHEFECQLCYKVCGTRQALDKHKLMHKRKYTYPCNYCGITYKNKGALTQHKLSHTKEKLFSCPYCSMVCESTHSLGEHKKIHDSSKKYICHICGLECKSRHSYRIHILSKHPNEKRFQCEICKESFHFERTLQIHRKKHTTNEKFPCEYCQKKFKTKRYLKFHASVAHKNLISVSKT